MCVGGYVVGYHKRQTEHGIHLHVFSMSVPMVSTDRAEEGTPRKEVKME